MSPSNSMTNIENGLNLNAVSLSYFPILSSIPSFCLLLLDLNYLIFGEFRDSRSSLSDHIHKVVSLITKKQMVRSNTLRIVAAMKNKHAFRYWAVSKKPCDPMSIFHRQFSILFPSERAISISKK